MFWSIAGIVGLIAAAGFVAWLILYVRYRRSPAKIWRDRVWRLKRTAEARIVPEQQTLERLDAQREAEAGDLRDDAFARFLRTISVNELERYPGIGPATIAKLKDAGCANIVDLHGGRVRIQGFGQKRLADLHAGVAKLTKDARSRFDACACAEAQECARRVDALFPQYEEPACRARARRDAAQKVLDSVQPLLLHAAKVSFLRHYLRSSTLPLVAEEVRETALPDLDTAVAIAERDVKPAPSPRSVPGDLFQDALHSSAKPAFREGDADYQLAAIELTVQLAFAAARADGRIARREKEVIEEHIERRFSHDPVTHQRAREWCAHYESAGIDVDACLRRISQLFAPGQRALLFDLIEQTLTASNGINDREAEWLGEVSRRLGVPRAQPAATPALPQPMSQPVVNERPTPAESRESQLLALEISPATPLSADLIRRQYNLLSDRFAPEKFELMGPEFVDMARTKRETIQRAAEALIQAFGEKLERSPEPASQALRHNPDLDAVFGV